MGKRNNTKVVKWNLFFYFIDFVYNISIGVFLVPLYLKYIPQDLYGYWLASGNILTIITLVNPGFSDIITQRISYYYGNSDYNRVGCYSLCGVSLNIIVSLVVFMIGYVFYVNLHYVFPGISPVLLNELINASKYTLVGTTLILIYYSVGAIDYGILSSRSIGVINCMANFFSLFMIVFFLRQGNGLVSLGYAAIIRGSIYLSGSVAYTMYRFIDEKILLGYRRDVLKDILSTSGYNFLGKLGMNAVANLNSFLCARYISPLEATNLKMTQTVPELGKLVVSRVLSSVAPAISNMNGQKKPEELAGGVYYLLLFCIWLLGIITIGFLLLNKLFISLWVGTSFYLGYSINLTLVLLTVFSCANLIFSTLLFSVGDIKRNNVALFYKNVVQVFLMLIGVYLFDLFGMLIAALLCELLILFFYYLRNFDNWICLDYIMKHNLIREVVRISAYVIVSVCIGYFFLVENQSWAIFIFYSVSIAVSYFFFLLFSKEFRKILLKKLNCKR